ncbi:hypothetical protein [Salisediminibacterium beveridgei]|uniref:Uncharacterized protein n=1 Tax=Salisediminibacterium beveridgei TaxID=632773 RepID=A0A1D7QTP4_9BACI|nr:hypothetical protein [Salisediminibacterium beveridgei]AOM82359.1 hypothetical protein BBEV_0990 [Salisediminibacterium beveridgei]
MKKKSSRITSLEHHRKKRANVHNNRQFKAVEGENLVDFTSRKKQKEIMNDMYLDDGDSSGGPRLPPNVRKNRSMVDYQKGPVFWLILIGVPTGFVASVLFASWLFVRFWY